MLAVVCFRNMHFYMQGRRRGLVKHPNEVICMYCLSIMSIIYNIEATPKPVGSDPDTYGRLQYLANPVPDC
jgi:hypothetical protein